MPQSFEEREVEQKLKKKGREKLLEAFIQTGSTSSVPEPGAVVEAVLKHVSLDCIGREVGNLISNGNPKEKAYWLRFLGVLMREHARLNSEAEDEDFMNLPDADLKGFLNRNFGVTVNATKPRRRNRPRKSERPPHRPRRTPECEGTATEGVEAADGAGAFGGVVPGDGTPPADGSGGAESAPET
jgi:hypothetical protein